MDDKGTIKVSRGADGSVKVYICLPRADRSLHEILGSCRSATSLGVSVPEDWDQRCGLLAEIDKLTALKHLTIDRYIPSLEKFGELCRQVMPELPVRVAGHNNAVALLLQLGGLQMIEELKVCWLDCRGPIGYATAQLPRLKSLWLGAADQSTVESLVDSRIETLCLDGRFTTGAMLRALHRMKGLRRLMIRFGPASFSRRDEDELRKALRGTASVEVSVGRLYAVEDSSEDEPSEEEPSEEEPSEEESSEEESSEEESSEEESSEESGSS